jgi:glutamate dehydrogenase (NAD(P)+)
MEIYKDPAFDMAVEQFRLVADHLNISDNIRQRLVMPKRAVMVTLPVHMDDGTTRIFQGYRVQHHLAFGPTKGGTRFHPNVSLGEVAALAMWMSWKCALAGLPYGGAKGGITLDPAALSPRELETVSRRYMQEMIPFVGARTDIMGPDMGTGEQVMAWFMDTYSVHMGYAMPEIVTGKPVSIGGTIGRREATGRGVAYLVERAFDVLKMDGHQSTAVVQGFGNVGGVAADWLFHHDGVKIIGLGDAFVNLYNPAGFDVPAALEHVRKNGSLAGLPGESISAEQLLTLKCDVLIPAALERVITEDIAPRIQCRILAEGANGPTTPAADQILFQRWEEIFVIPDILCNAGGVIVSYFEWVQDLQNFFWTETEVTDRLFRILEGAFTGMLKRARAQRIPHRIAAMSMGVERVVAAKVSRGLFP